MAGSFVLNSPRVEILDSIEAVNQWFYEQKLTDGFPIIPPTEERVQVMLEGLDRPPQEDLGLMPPRWAPITVEKIAINAVMAGCLPTYMPVLVTAVEAMLEPAFNLYGAQATTFCGGPMLIINGPIARELEVNCDLGCLGPGWQANATIGRAIRLILLNIGGGLPGAGDMATFGWPGKYTFCWAENEARSPWEPLHVERGFQVEDSTVTVAFIGGFHNITDAYSTKSESLLSMIALAMRGKSSNLGTGGMPACVLGPDHAAILAGDGLSKVDVKRHIFEKARVPQRLEAGYSIGAGGVFEKVAMDAEGRIMIADREEDIMVLVAGGSGPHSASLHTWGRESLWVTRAIPRMRS